MICTIRRFFLLAFLFWSEAEVHLVLDLQHKLMNLVIAMNKQATQFSKPERDYCLVPFRGYYRGGNQFGGRGGYKGRAFVGQKILAAIGTHIYSFIHFFIY
jgi:hypothetical protein